MIAKGNLHAHGQKLAAYMVSGKKHEHAELVELRGFLADDIRDAFLDVHIQSEATRCEKPFFHAQIRLPDTDHLDRDQWLAVADRIEQQLGFEGQGRAVAFHQDQRTGETHMHIAWSRIDLENVNAIDPGLYKNKLKEISRELEKEYGLTPVANERPENQKTRAAERNEAEQARRLGTDLTAIRESVRDCWDRSDTGRSFIAALEDKGFILAQGDRRDFVVIDHAGGEHALGKRITDATAAETRARMADIDRAQLPGVDQAKEMQAERAPGREAMQWDNQLAAAAIAKEQKEGNLLPDPKAALRIDDATIKRDEARQQQDAAKPPTYSEQKVLNALAITKTGPEFVAFLEKAGITLARASAEDIQQLDEKRALGHRFVPSPAEQEVVVVTRRGDVRQFNQNRVDILAVEKRLTDAPPLLSITDTHAGIAQRWQERVAGTGHERRAPSSSPAMLPSPDRMIDRIGGRVLGSLFGSGMLRALDVLAGGKPNPERMTSQQLDTYIAEQRAKAAADRAAAPTNSEVERQTGIARNQRHEEERRQILDAWREQQRSHPSERERGDDGGREK